MSKGVRRIKRTQALRRVQATLQVREQMNQGSIFSEKLFPLIDLPKRLPKKRGKRLSVATVYRWKSVGLAGVKLEIAYVQGEAHTSLQAVERFNRAVTQVKTESPAVITLPKSTDRQVAIAHHRAKENLAKKRARK